MSSMPKSTRQRRGTTQSSSSSDDQLNSSNHANTRQQVRSHSPHSRKGVRSQQGLTSPPRNSKGQFVKVQHPQSQPSSVHSSKQSKQQQQQQQPSSTNPNPSNHRTKGTTAPKPQTMAPPTLNGQRKAAAEGHLLDWNELQAGNRRVAVTPKILLPSQAAFAVLLIIPLLLWFTCTIFGLQHFRGLVKKRDVQHVMLWYDIVIFRFVGPLLPLFILLSRYASVTLFWSAWKLQQKPTTTTTTANNAATASLPPQPTLSKESTSLHLVAIFWRLMIYVLHTFYQEYVTGHVSQEAAVMSDHVLLAACVTACLVVELVCSISDALKVVALGGGFMRQAFSTMAVVSVITLFGCTSLDMYFTCRFYHLPQESMVALILGLLLFQAPILIWLNQKYKTCSQP